MVDRCVCCGEPVPEGYQVCPVCMDRTMNRKISPRARRGIDNGFVFDPEARTSSFPFRRVMPDPEELDEDPEVADEKPMTAEEKLLEYLKLNHTGKDNAVYSKDLERVFCMSGRTIRTKINRLRQDGKPICSDCNGYYYAETDEDVKDTIRWMDELLTGVASAREGLLVATVIPADAIRKPGSMTITIDVDIDND